MPVTTEQTGTVTRSVPSNEHRQGHILVKVGDPQTGVDYYIHSAQIKGRTFPKVGDIVRFKASAHRPGFAAKIVSALA